MLRCSLWILAVGLIFGAEGAPHRSSAPDREPAPKTTADAPQAESTPERQIEPAETDKPTEPDKKRTAQPPRAMNRDAGPSQEESIAKALFSRTSIAAQDVSLTEVLESLAREHDIQIQVDQAALDEDGVSVEIPVACTVRNLRLSSILNQLLHPRHLEWLVQDEVLKITTQDAANQTFETHVYAVGHLMEAEHSPDDLVDTIVACIAPDSWVDEGGGGVIKLAPRALVIRQTQHVHGEIERLLIELEEASLDVEQPAERPAAVAVRRLRRSAPAVREASGFSPRDAR